MPKLISKSCAFLTCLALGMAAALPSVAAQNQIEDVRLWSAPDHTRVVFDTSTEPEHVLFALKSPDRLVVDIKNATMKANLNAVDVGKGPVKRIRSGVRNGDDLRIVLDLNGPLSPKSFVLSPNQKYGHRLVIDLNKGAESLKRDQKPSVANEDGDRDVIIAIDAGHGGEDPGAIGPAGTYEKNVVLKMAKELKAEVDRHEGYRAVLTRTGDYYINLSGRTALARKHGADLFVSLHADAFKSSRPRGASVFALSQKGATSETAKWLADKENRSDLIGGAGPLSINDKQSSLASVLLDLSMTSSINTGINMGSLMLNEMKKVTKLHKKQVEQAAFVVLKSPDIPSLLVESGFISNPQEERNLNSSSYRVKFVRAMFVGINDYFRASPPPGTLLAKKRNERFAQSGY